MCYEPYHPGATARSAIRPEPIVALTDPVTLTPVDARSADPNDQVLIVHVSGRGLVVLTGCGHAGIVNLVRYARRLTGIDEIAAVVGGFHLGVSFATRWDHRLATN